MPSNSSVLTIDPVLEAMGSHLDGLLLKSYLDTKFINNRNDETIKSIT